MNIEEVRDYCISLAAVEESTPFGPDVLVYKVANKMFAAIGLDGIEARVNLKCDPERAIDLRDHYDDIIPGYHMSKKHWNSVYTERGLEASFIRELVDHSYDLVFRKLPKKIRVEIEEARS